MRRSKRAPAVEALVFYVGMHEGEGHRWPQPLADEEERGDLRASQEPGSLFDEVPRERRARSRVR